MPNRVSCWWNIYSIISTLLYSLSLFNLSKEVVYYLFKNERDFKGIGWSRAGFLSGLLFSSSDLHFSSALLLPWSKFIFSETICIFSSALFQSDIVETIPKKYSPFCKTNVNIIRKRLFSQYDLLNFCGIFSQNRLLWTVFQEGTRKATAASIHGEISWTLIFLIRDFPPWEVQCQPWICLKMKITTRLTWLRRVIKKRISNWR